MITLADILCTTIVPFSAAMICVWLVSRWKQARLLAPAFSIAFGLWAGKFATDLRDVWGTRDAQLSATERVMAAAQLAVLQQVQPTEAHDWLPLFGLVSAVLLGLTMANNRRGWFLVLGFAMALLIPLRMLWSSVYFVRDWGTVELCLRMAAIVVCMAVPVFVLPRWPADENRPRHILMPVLVAMGLLAAAMTFMLTGSKTYGELGGALSFAFLGAWCGGLLSGTPWGYNDLPVVSLLLGGMAVLVTAYSATPVWQVLVVGSGMTAACLALRSNDAARRKPTVAVVVIMASILLVVGVAAWRFANATKADDPYSQYLK